MSRKKEKRRVPMSTEILTIPQIKRTQTVAHNREDSSEHSVILFDQRESKNRKNDRRYKQKKAPRIFRRAPDLIRGKVIDLIG